MSAGHSPPSHPPVDHTVALPTGFSYRDGGLLADAVAIADIAAAVGTPFYCYATGALTTTWNAFASAFAGSGVKICYALKANSNLAVIRTLGALGAGADVVSAGELARALAAGIPADRIVFSGVGKTAAELAEALTAGIHQINVESVPELEELSAVASGLGLTAPIALRVNPDVDALTHHKISTGKKENKFGIDIATAGEVFARAAALPGIRPVGIAVHIGSQLTSLAPFAATFARLRALVAELRGRGIPISRLDLGGGLGITYRQEQPPAIADYARLVCEATAGLDCAVTLEPGRALVGNAGILVSQVVYRKQGLHRDFLILDAAMNDLIRPALYEAYHGIVPVRQPDPAAAVAPIDVVGPVCETGDTFAVQRALPPLDRHDLVAFLSAGAYGAVMASTYNSRPLVPEVLVDGDRFAVVRRRPSFAESLALEQAAPWQSGD